jgi:hypothetical protein
VKIENLVKITTIVGTRANVASVRTGRAAVLGTYRMATLDRSGLASNSIPQSLCHHSDLGFDSNGGIQADIFTVTRTN